MAMKLSEYIKRLQAIAREQKRDGRDPDVIIGRFSDYESVDDDKPALVTVRWNARFGMGQNYLMEIHPTMTDEQKAEGIVCVEVAQGN